MNSIFTSYLNQNYINYLYLNNVDLRKGINYLINDALERVEYTTDLDITIKELKQILRSYIKYGASLYDSKENKVYNLLNSTVTKEGNILLNNQIDSLNNINITNEELGYIWIGGDDDNLFYTSQDWYTIAKNVSINVSLDNNFQDKLDSGTFKEGFFYLIGDLFEKDVTKIDAKIKQKLADKTSNLALLPIATDEKGQVDIGFIELANTTEEFLSNKYNSNKAEIAQGLGTLNERTMNLQPSLRSGNYSSTANERLTLLLNIYNRNVRELQTTLQEEYKDHIDFDFYNEDIQESKQGIFERTRSVYQDGVISNDEYLETYNNLFESDYKGNKYINQFNTSGEGL